MEVGKKLHFHLFPTSNIYITLYFNVSSTLLRKNRNTDFLYIYIYIGQTGLPCTQEKGDFGAVSVMEQGCDKPILKVDPSSHLE